MMPQKKQSEQWSRNTQLWYNKEVRSVYTKLTKEDREKSKNSAKAQVDNKDNKQQTSTDNSANVAASNNLYSNTAYSKK